MIDDVAVVGLLWSWGWAGKDFSEAHGYSWSAILDFQIEFVADTAVHASIAQIAAKR